jgi:hypothetical protein
MSATTMLGGPLGSSNHITSDHSGAPQGGVSFVGTSAFKADTRSVNAAPLIGQPTGGGPSDPGFEYLQSFAVDGEPDTNSGPPDVGEPLSLGHVASTGQSIGGAAVDDGSGVIGDSDAADPLTVGLIAQEDAIATVVTMVSDLVTLSTRCTLPAPPPVLDI